MISAMENEAVVERLQAGSFANGYGTIISRVSEPAGALVSKLEYP